jgi:hypothetical protein
MGTHPNEYLEIIICRIPSLGPHVVLEPDKDELLPELQDITGATH